LPASRFLLSFLGNPVYQKIGGRENRVLCDLLLPIQSERRTLAYALEFKVFLAALMILLYPVI
jgi:hypothetical protein